ncbi:hypothetical protein F9K84_05825 [Brucella anthropi]|uniref:hypothetical protein n=1 Tax=Brucella anthropi TaxID=529 RepID=UPI00124D8BB5|nr:hypothetical protein [Brucella anthropi]KAB2770264.1 hypothetical protein F9K84_05825 [Brucella anthropi]
MVQIPAELLNAVVAEGGAKLAVVIGAGCSIELPTGMPLAGDLSADAYRRLVNERLLLDGECANPRDLSALASLVFEKTGSQAALVRQFPLDRMKMARGNEGYRVLIALMLEGVISHALSLNFDLAPQNAASELGEPVTIIDRVNEPIPMTKTVVHLHGSVNGSSEDLILRTEVINDAWKEKWQEVVARQILAAPNVLFVGLGSDAPVLSRTVNMITGAVGHQKTFYQADIGEHAANYFSQQLQVAAERYIKGTWGEVMSALATHLAREQVHSLITTGTLVLRDNQVTAEDITRFQAIAGQLSGLSLLGLGRLRANARLNQSSKYQPRTIPDDEWLTGPLATLAIISDAMGFSTQPKASGIWHLKQANRICANVLLATGRGVRKIAALETSIRAVSRDLAELTGNGPDLVLVGGVIPELHSPSAAPVDIIDGDDVEDIITGPRKPLILAIDEGNVIESARRWFDAA